MNIRPATLQDLPALTNIYNYYVLNAQATFDTEPYTVEQRKKWFDAFSETGKYRLLVAEADGQILGCGSSSQYRTHPAFNETVEFGVYISYEIHGKGLGSALYSALFEIMKSEDVHLVVAGVALPNPGSVALHKKFGFREVGIFTEYARKNGNYISSVWFEKQIGGHQ